MKVITVGRSQECNIVVNDDKASRLHLQLVQDDEGHVSAVDLGSTNGTYVNGQRIASECRLVPGDEVRIGDTVLPWQKYFDAPLQSVPQIIPSQPVDGGGRQPKRQRTLLWVIIGVGALLATSVTGWLVYKHNSQKTYKTIEEQQRQKAQEEAQNLQLALDKAEIEYKDALLRAAATNSKADKAKADSLADVIKTKRDKLTDLTKKIDTLKNNIIKANSDATAAQEAAEKAKTAAQAARDSIAIEQGKATDAETETKLTEEFYDLMFKATDESINDIFKKLGGDAGKDISIEKKREYIVQQFKKKKGHKKKEDFLKHNVRDVVNKQNPENTQEGNPQESTSQPSHPSVVKTKTSTTSRTTSAGSGDSDFPNFNNPDIEATGF